MIKRLKSGLTAAAAVLGGIYFADLVVARLRGDSAFGSVHVNVLYAIPEKAARMDFSPGGTQEIECVKSLLPHFGDAPCWYASKQKTKRVDL